MLTVSLVLAGFLLGTSPTHAQTRDGLLNGAAIGAGAGLGLDALFSHSSPSTATTLKRTRLRAHLPPRERRYRHQLAMVSRFSSWPSR
jgi:hypothetical protein